jgi:predicted GIY-YIG superfamily endonuclease
VKFSLPFAWLRSKPNCAKQRRLISRRKKTAPRWLRTKALKASATEGSALLLSGVMGFERACFNYVYLIRSQKEPERIAVGITPNLAFGLAQHNAGAVPSTEGFRPWSVTVALAFRESAAAERFERYLHTSAGRRFARRHF